MRSFTRPVYANCPELTDCFLECRVSSQICRSSAWHLDHARQITAAESYIFESKSNGAGLATREALVFGFRFGPCPGFPQRVPLKRLLKSFLDCSPNLQDLFRPARCTKLSLPADDFSPEFASGGFLLQKISSPLLRATLADISLQRPILQSLSVQTSQWRHRCSLGGLPSLYWSNKAQYRIPHPFKSRYGPSSVSVSSPAAHNAHDVDLDVAAVCFDFVVAMPNAANKSKQQHVMSVFFLITSAVLSTALQ